LRRRENVRGHLNGILIDDEVPVFNGLLVEKFSHHLLDSPNLLLGIDPCLSKSISHAWTFSDTIRYAVEKTKLSG
jgi:hypothetical protein